jgi:hypothetical protein
MVRSTYREEIWTNNRAICDAINELVSGNELAGQEFIPSEGEIYVVPIEKTDLTLDSKEVFQWSNADFSFQPEVIVASGNNGFLITGKELQLA